MFACTLWMRQLKREFLLQTRQIRFLINACLFFLMFLFVFPLTLKPELSMMKMIAPGLIWMALLLSMLLSSEKLLTQDHEQGVIEQWMVSGQSLSLILSAKITAQWLSHLVPLLLLSPLIALLFSFTLWEISVLVLSLVCGTPALFFLCTLTAALSLGEQQSSAWMALILFPLTLPVLIFGSGTLFIAMQGLPISPYLALLLAMSALAVGFLPYAISGVIRVSAL